METSHDTGSHTGTEATAAAVGGARGVLRWEYSLRLLQLSLPNATPEIPDSGASRQGQGRSAVKAPGPGLPSDMDDGSEAARAPLWSHVGEFTPLQLPHLHLPKFHKHPNQVCTEMGSVSPQILLEISRTATSLHI